MKIVLDDDHVKEVNSLDEMKTYIAKFEAEQEAKEEERLEAERSKSYAKLNDTFNKLVKEIKAYKKICKDTILLYSEEDDITVGINKNKVVLYGKY